jgi:hypothetical protein
MIPGVLELTPNFWRHDRITEKHKERRLKA